MQILKSNWSIEQNWLEQGERYLGPRRVYYDGVFYSFGLWFWHCYLTDCPHVQDQKP